MKDFLKENWIWIVAPFVAACVILVALMFVGGVDESSPFIYTIR